MTFYILKYVQTILRGIGQVMFQNNIYSGLLFLAGIFYNSWILGLAALAGTIISTSTANVLKFSDEDINNGLYGFNGTLTGIALLFFFELNTITIAALILGSICSTLVMYQIKKILPAFTSPFVITTWVFIYSLLFIFNQKLVLGSSVLSESIDVVSVLFNGFGQVMFQENIITGIFFLFAIFVNSRLSASYAVFASILGPVFGWIFTTSFSALNAGLMGYNAILCAIALAGTKKIDFAWISLAVLLSVLFQLGISAIGMITLTAPFVLSTWIVLLIKKKLIK